MLANRLMLEGIKTKVASMMNGTNKTTAIITVCVIIIFITLAVYVYKTYVVPSLSSETYIENGEYHPSDRGVGGGDIDVFYFYTDWCPHCKKGRPSWDDFKLHNGGNFNGHVLTYHEIDCDKDEDIANQFGVESYPTIKLRYEGKIYDYEAKPNTDTLNQFLASSV